MNKPKTNVSLIFCLAMDALGYATYAIPLLGELGDIVWAPLSAFIFYRTFGTWKGSLFNFMEELLPGFDFIPSFTLMWFWQTAQQKFSRKPASRYSTGMLLNRRGVK